MIISLRRWCELAGRQWRVVRGKPAIKLYTRVIAGPPVTLRCACGEPLITLEEDETGITIGCPTCCPVPDKGVPKPSKCDVTQGG